MKRRTSSTLAFGFSVFAATLAAATMAGSALADDINPYPIAPFVGERTRAEVKAELMSQRDLSSAGSEWALQRNYAQQDPSYTRQQARADYIAARNEVHAMTSEDSGSAALALAQARARAPSRAVTTAAASH